MIAQLIDGDNIGVLKATCRLCLAEEPLQQIGIVGVPTDDHLDRDKTVQVRVSRLVNDSHSTASNDVDDVVLPDFGWSIEGHNEGPQEERRERKLFDRPLPQGRVLHVAMMRATYCATKLLY